MTEVRHPLFARFYHRMRSQEDQLGITDMRRALLAGLSGRVLEVGAGDGANFALYPPTVTGVDAVEPEPYLRTRAEQAAARAAVPIRVVDGVAEQLPFPDEAFDAVVSALVLCSVRDPECATGEMVRVLRPGGELRFLEHVRAGGGRLATAQRLLAPVQALFGGGCHPDRDTVGVLRDAGFEIETLRSFDFQPNPIARLSRPHVEGTAVRPVDRLAGPTDAR